MNYIPTNLKINLEWSVKKGVGNEAEDFSRSTVALFVFSDENRWPVPCEADYTGVVKAQLPETLPEGVYSLDLVWYKNEGSLNATRSVQRTRKTCVFAIDAATLPPAGYEGQPVTLKMSSIAAPYGYDGLSAYEIAVLRGATTLDEYKWSKGLFNDVLANELKENQEELKQNQLELGKTKIELYKQSNQIDALKDPIKPLITNVDGKIELLYGKGLYVEEGKLCAKEFVLPEGSIPVYSEGKGVHISEDKTISVATDEEDISVNENDKLSLKDRSNTDGMGYVILRKNKSFLEQVKHPNTIYEIRYDFDLGRKSYTASLGTLVTVAGTAYVVDEKYITLAPGDTLTVPNGYAIVDSASSYILASPYTATESANVYVGAPKSTHSLGSTCEYSVEQKTEIPENCVLKFEGGSLRNGTVEGKGTHINENASYNIFNDTDVSGFELSYIDLRWCGGISDYNESVGTGTDNSIAFTRAIELIGKYYNGLYINIVGQYYVGSEVETNYDLNIRGSHNVTRNLLNSAEVSSISSPSLIAMGPNSSFYLKGRGNESSSSKYLYFNIQNIKVVGTDRESSEFIKVIGGGGPSRVCIVEECEFRWLYNVIYINNSADTMVGDLTISKCLAYNNNKFIYAFSDNNKRTLCNFIIKDSNIEHNSSKCIHLLKTFSSVIIDNNILEGQHEPIHIGTTKGSISITNNYFESNTGYVVTCQADSILSTLSFEKNFMQDPIDVLFTGFILTSKIPNNSFTEKSVISGVVYDIDGYNLKWIQGKDGVLHSPLYVSFPYFKDGINNYRIRCDYGASKFSHVGTKSPTSLKSIGAFNGSQSSTDILNAAVWATESFYGGFYQAGSGHQAYFNIGPHKHALVFIRAKAFRDGQHVLMMRSISDDAIHNVIHLFTDAEDIRPADVLVPNISTPLSGLKPAFEEKPIGFQYYDTNLNKPIWWTGTAWVDATGAEV